MRAKKLSGARQSSASFRLTLDAKLQASLETLAREAAAAIGPKLSCAILVIDNASGEIRAHVGAADYFSQERAGSIDMTSAIRSPGSTLKPFIYALAFENGIAHPETILDDRPRHYGSYAPENFDLSFQGTVTARHALQSSLNLPAVELLDDDRPRAVYRAAAQCGGEGRAARMTPRRDLRRRWAGSASVFAILPRFMRALRGAEACRC